MKFRMKAGEIAGLIVLSIAVGGLLFIALASVVFIFIFGSRV